MCVCLTCFWVCVCKCICVCVMVRSVSPGGLLWPCGCARDVVVCVYGFLFVAYPSAGVVLRLSWFVLY